MDVRDIPGDITDHVSTLAARLGAKATVSLALFLCLAGMAYAALGRSGAGSAELFMPLKDSAMLDSVIVASWVFLLLRRLSGRKYLWLLAESIKLYMFSFVCLMLWNTL
jgi:hypothetical protein